MQNTQHVMLYCDILKQCFVYFRVCGIVMYSIVSTGGSAVAEGPHNALEAEMW